MADGMYWVHHQVSNLGDLHRDDGGECKWNRNSANHLIHWAHHTLAPTPLTT